MVASTTQEVALFRDLWESKKFKELISKFSKTWINLPDPAKMMLAQAYSALDRCEEAIQIYDFILELEPNFYPAIINKANLFLRAGAFESAIKEYEKVPKSYKDYSLCLFNMAVAVIKTGNIELASKILNEAIQIEPQNVKVLNLLGEIYRTKGDYRLSATYYKRSYGLNPNNLETCLQLSILLDELQNIDGAIALSAKVVSAEPEYMEGCKVFCGQLSRYSFRRPNPVIYDPADRILNKKFGVRAYTVARALMSSLKKEEELKEFFSNDEINSADEVSVILGKLSSFPVFITLLKTCTIPDVDFERSAKRLRKAYTFNLDNIKLNNQKLHALEALAIQCFLTEFVYSGSVTEGSVVSALVDELDRPEAIEIPNIKEKLLCIALYKEITPKIWKNKEQHFLELYKKHVDNRLTESRLQRDIVTLSTIMDSTSLAVKMQYEENPYPRWVTGNHLTGRSTANEYYRAIGISFDETNIQLKAKQHVLIAGCGTGQHSIEIAYLLENAEVLGLDLSSASLAYATRKTSELGLKNLNYIQGDLLDVSKLQRKFDLIESGGVLHHMQNPIDGWRALTEVLYKGGLMKIALYSKLAREDVSKVRELIVEKNIQNIPSSVKSLRDDLINEKIFPGNSLKHSIDFYSTSNVRDLLFHVQEHQFTLRQIKQSLFELNLKFCGFDNPNIRKQFLEFFGSDANLLDLELWNTFEEAYPSTFKGMYQFWCQKI